MVLTIRSAPHTTAGVSPRQQDIVGDETLRRPARYYFSPSFRNGEPCVVLLVGRSWRPAMRRHYGLDELHFFCREAYAGEPDTYPNRHPWGWVFRPEMVLQYEQASGMQPERLQQFAELVRRQVASIPFGEAACH